MKNKQKELNTSQYIVKERIKLGEKIAYGLGDVAINIIWSGISGFATYYYTNSAGLAAAAIGTMFLISRILDGISDILMGLIVDRTKSKHGKSRAWVLWMAIPFGLVAFLAFSIPPGWGSVAKLIYAYITYNLASTIIFTAISVSYSSLMTRITDNEIDRTSLSAFRMFGAMICGLAINIIVIPLVNGLGGGQKGWSITFAILGVISAILFFICFAGTKERVGSSVAGEEKKDDVPVKEALKALVKNKFWLNRAVNSLTSSIIMAGTGVNVYYAAYWLNNEEAVGIISIVNVLPMIVTMLLSTYISRVMSKRNMSIMAAVISMVGLVIQAINPGSLVTVLAGCAVRGIGTGLLSAISWVMMAEVVDYGEWKTGVRSEGLVFSAISFGQKVGAGLGSAMLGWALAIGGFDAAAAVQTESAKNSILAVFTYIPFVLQIIILILSVLYTVEKQMPQIREDLLKKRTETN